MPAMSSHLENVANIALLNCTTNVPVVYYYNYMKLLLTEVYVAI